MVTRWSYNVDGLDVDNAVWELLLADARTNPPTYITIMDNKNFAKQWRREIPSTQVIYRTYDSFDTEYHHKVTPVAAAIQLERDHSDMRDFWHYYRLNEPSPPWGKYQDWILRFAEETKRRGFKVTAGGLALGKMWNTPDFIRNGNADAFLDYAIANEDTFLVDDHQYVTGFAWSPQIQTYPSAIFDRDLILANENIPVLVDDYVGYQGMTNWGLYRISWLANARSLERHKKRLNFVINEGVNDWNAHIFTGQHTYSTLPNGQRVLTEPELRKYAEPLYDRQIWGVMAHWLYYSWVVTGKMQKVSEPEFCDIVIRNLKFVERTQPENCKGIMLFAINRDWSLPAGQDYSPIIRTLLPKMRSLAINTTPIPLPDPVPLPTIETYTARIRSNTVGLRLRAKPSAKPDSVTLATFPQLAWLGANVSKQRWQADNYSWVYLELTIDGKQYAGYAADQYLSIETVEPEIDLTVAELELVHAYRSKDIDALLRLIDMPDVIRVDNTEKAILEAFEDKDVRRMLTFTLAITE